MQDLKETILLLDQHGIHPLKGVGSRSKLLALWSGIIEGRFATDESAAMALYNEGLEGSKYRKLKSDLRNRLMESVLEIDGHQKSYSDYQKAYYECNRQWMAVRILTGQNANSAAIAMSARLLRQAEKYDFTLLAMDVASYLRTQYGLRENNDKKFREAHESFEHYRKVYDAESEAESLYSMLIVRFVNNRSVQASICAQAEEYWQIIQPKMLAYQTYKLQMYGYLISLMRFTLSNNYYKALEVCNQALAFFHSRAYEPRVPLQIFYYQRLICNIQLQQFEQGHESAEYCLRTIQEGTFNWFKYNELHLQLSLHTGNYQQASETLYLALNHNRFEFLPDNVKEIWRLYEAFVHYLVLCGKVPSGPGTHKFRLARFINETPIFSKDKCGINVAIIVVKILLMLQEKRYSEILTDLDALEQYCYRHLRVQNVRRSYYFLKMLLSIPANNFELSQSTEKAAHFLLKLKETSLQLNEPNQEIEVIRYEVLWEIVLESLESRKKIGVAA